ncbi:serine hydroxymethyltransferase [Buchnera aphidicola]|uniref:Serine hydroxymethyltransferase n=1 Tax=Buchnera aphidicola subsp. Uroleucon sonchi TaxID=118118 RepID=A0A6C1FAR8_BUCUN|nr:serine hydroxymethyltransferase [Buchnera aphidicola]QIE02004.1 aminotransferase class I/II-fold pyridoxal phosphate-dependent enzyme [Buchnera aphidicola (Uroleucon sonchi)]
MNNKIDFSKYDPEIWDAIKKEKIRQENHIELIASENYASEYVMYAQGSQLTNKYAEGYPGKRYYGGCQYVDRIEEIAINRAKKLFHADYANVQPHSGSQANFAVYTALLKPGDTILGMKLSHGGHLTHGASVNFSGKMYNVISYGVDNHGIINYEELLYLTKKYKPKMIIGGFSAYSGICDWKKMREIANVVNAYFIVDIAHIAGLIAAKIYPSPINYAHVVTSTTHKTLAGPRGGLILAKNGNENLYKKLNLSVFPGAQGGPLMHVIAAKAIAFKEALEPKFKIYQQQIIKNSQIMVKNFLERGYAVISKKTDNHLFLIDLTNKNITGKEADIALSKANITINKNTIPNDAKSPFITSGIRIGTAAITRRGFQEKESYIISNWIADILNNISDNKNICAIKKQVLDMCLKYPVYILN